MPRLTALTPLFLLSACADPSPGGASASASASSTSAASSAETTAVASSSSAATSVRPTEATGEGGSSGTTDGSTGEASSSSTSGDTDESTGGDDDPVGAVGPTWLRALDGLILLAPPRALALPDGDVVALVSGGLYGDEIIVAAGDPDEVVLTTTYVAPALARFDGESGAVKEARLLAHHKQGTPYGMSVLTRTVVPAEGGDLLVAGTWFGSAEFFPGTADSAAMVAEIKLNGDLLDRAEEPFFYRMTPSGAVTWLIRGRTPPGLQTTWFNYDKGIAALPGGEAAIAGEFEQAGFIVAAGAPGEKVMAGSQGSYFARLGASGSPTWVYRNSHRLPYVALRSGADGALYSLLPTDATLFVDADAPVMTTSEPGLWTMHLGRVEGTGGVAWTATFAQMSPTPVQDFAVRDGGDLLVFGELTGELRLRDAGGALLTAQADTSQGWIAGLDAAGAGKWVVPLGPTVSLLGPSLVDDDAVWLAAAVAAPFELEVAGAMTPLPALGYPADATATVLLQIDVLGEVVSAQVLGASLPVSSLAWSDPERSSFIVAGATWCDAAQPHVVAGEGLAGLPSGCSMEPHDDQLGYVAAIPRSP